MKTRVKISNEIAGHATVVETPRDRGTVIFQLAGLVRKTNRRRGDLRAGLSVADNLITIHIHAPARSDTGAKPLGVGQPIHETAGISREILGSPEESQAAEFRREVEAVLWPERLRVPLVENKL